MVNSDALVLLNLKSGSKSASEKWEQSLPGISRVFNHSFKIFEFSPPCCLNERILAFKRNGGKYLISAGGDGTLNHILNLMIHAGLEDTLSLGAIALGSSCDFHKTIGKTGKTFTPLRINPVESRMSDIGECRIVAPDGSETKKYFVVNASVGITAYGNSLFNEARFPVGILKKYWTDGAIIFAALKGLMTYRDFQVTCTTEDKTELLNVTNINILKVPFVSGSFFYDDEIKPDDGIFSMKFSTALSKFDLIASFYGLLRGAFRENSNKFSRRGNYLFLRADTPFDLEIDGETFKAVSAEFKIYKHKIRLLGV